MSSKVFVGNLSWSVTDESLGEQFAQFGEIVECAVIRERGSNRSRGYAFVTFEDPAAAKKAIDAMNGVEFEGRPMNVNLAQSKRHDEIGS